MQFIVWNIGKIPVKNQLGKFLHTDSTLSPTFMDFFLEYVLTCSGLNISPAEVSERVQEC